MPKRKEQTTESDEEDSSIVNVEFEFFDPHAGDYLAVKNLLNQLFQGDAQSLGVEGLADLLVGQTLVGTTVKTDGRESDPYAFLSVVNLDVHNDNPSVASLRSYLTSKAPSAIPSSSSQSPKHTGWIFSERLINMPVQVVPPMYRMLRDEMQWALDENEPYDFGKLVFVSRTYTPTQEMEAEWNAEESSRSGKRLKETPTQTQQVQAQRTHSFHFEDDVIAKYAEFTVDYTYSRREQRDNESLGVETGGRIMVLDASKLSAVIEEMAQVFAPPNQ